MVMYKNIQVLCRCQPSRAQSLLLFLRSSDSYCFFFFFLLFFIRIMNENSKTIPILLPLFLSRIIRIKRNRAKMIYIYKYFFSTFYNIYIFIHN
ncbi:hypothetical protein H8356DRAFT_1638995, partial [Neocallimastix lanati (nom. inval.)]